MRNIIIGIICALGLTPINAQLTDLVRVEYTYFPQRESNNSFRRFRSFVNIPLKLNEKGAYLVPKLEYRNVDFKYNDPTPFNTDPLNSFQHFEVGLGYTFKLNTDWRFVTQVGLIAASNFETNKIIRDDLITTATTLFVKDKKGSALNKPSTLVLGLAYSTTSGRPLPLPIVSYTKKVTDKFSYTAGIPKSGLKYKINDKHILQTFVTLDGFFANVQNNKVIFKNNEEIDVDNISLTIVLAGIGYEYFFTKHLALYTFAGYTLLNDIRLRNIDKDDVLTINDLNSFYARAGIKFKI